LSIRNRTKFPSTAAYGTPFFVFCWKTRESDVNRAKIRPAPRRPITRPRIGTAWQKRNAVRVTPSKEDVFRDVGFSKAESEHLLVRADALIQVQKAIASSGLKQAEAAKALRVTQPRISDLLRGRIDLFSTDSLTDMLARLGVGVPLVVKPTRSQGVDDAGSLTLGLDEHCPRMTAGCRSPHECQ
jgi:predicted XRE-type DNA-binding protein